jgi:hypothetical protein
MSTALYDAGSVRLVKPLYEFTPQEAALLIAAHDRGEIQLRRDPTGVDDVYDDAILVAQGLGELVRDAAMRAKPQVLSCTVCRKEFTAGRSDAKYCSPACQRKASRKRLR